MLRKFTIAVALIIILIGVGASPSRLAQAQDLPQSFEIEPNHGWVCTNGWGVRVNVILTIDDDTDPNNGFDIQMEAETTPAEWNLDEGEACFEFGEQIEPGAYVSVTDNVITKDTWIPFLTFDGVDDAGMASGSGPTGWGGHVCLSYDAECQEIIVLGDGSWSSTFSWYDPLSTDLSGAHVVVYDEDWDGTIIHLFQGDPPPLPNFEIEPNHGWVCTGGWDVDVGLTLRIKYHEEDPDADSFLMDWLITEECEPGIGCGCFEYGQQVGPGMYVQVTDDVTVKETWIADLTFEAVDDDGTAWGAGASEWGGHVCLNYAGDCQEILVDEFGGWSAVFPWFDPETTDLSGAHVVVLDEDGDGTIVHLFQGPPPMSPVINAYPQFELVQGIGWPQGEVVTMVVDDDIDPDTGNLYFDTGVAGPSPWDPSQSFVSFDLRPFDLLAGHYVIMFSGEFFQVHQVTNLTLISIDHEADLATGSADAGTDVMVVVNWEDGADNFVTADGSGHWEADYSGQFDLSYGDMVTAFQHDENGNLTLVEKLIVTPGGLVDEIQNMPDELIADEIKKSLIKKVENAYSSYLKGNVTAAVNKLEALINEIDAQLGNKISEDLTHHLHMLVHNLIRNFEE